MLVCSHVAFTLLAFAIAISGVDAGCKSSADCKNNFDCIDLGFFLGSTCAPKSCAVEAVQTMIDEGFDPQKWVDDITAQTGSIGKGSWGGTSNEDAEKLRRAYESVDPPPIDALNRYFEDCINPKGNAGREQMLMSTQVYHGWQWSVGAGLLYTGKHLWVPLHRAGTAQLIEHCVGGYLGAQVGAASYVAYFQTYNIDIDDRNTWPVDPDRPDAAQVDPAAASSYCVPIFMVGLFQVSVCCSTGSGTTCSIIEVSVGAQLGAGLCGFQACWSQVCSYPFDPDFTDLLTLAPSPALNFTLDDFFSVLCSTATRLEIGDSVTESTSGRVAYYFANDCGDATQASSPGFYYKVRGDGKTITIDTCFSETDFDTQISVWSSCLDLTCVAGNDDQGSTSCPSNSFSSKVSWDSISGTDYFVFVQGRFSTSAGTFKMEISSA